VNGHNPHFRVEIDLKKVGKWLRETREERHLSIRELAKLCGMSATQVNRMETGEDFTITKLVMLAVPLGIPPAVLIDGGLAVHIGLRGREHQDALVADAELSAILTASKGENFAAVNFALLELVDLIAIFACRLLISSNPAMALPAMEIPLPTLRRKFEQFIVAYGLETDTVERAAIFRSIMQHPVRKLRALGLLTKEIVEEYLRLESARQESASPYLTDSEAAGSDKPMLNAPAAWPQLVERAKQVTHAYGDKARMARDLGVTRQAVNQWLNGENAPSAELTLQLLNWVAAEEAKQK
jgi:transcriptional regulator with XRE-family HTH domain